MDDYMCVRKHTATKWNALGNVKTFYKDTVRALKMYVKPSGCRTCSTYNQDQYVQLDVSEHSCLVLNHYNIS